MKLKNKVYFEHHQNLMKNEGDIKKARAYFFENKNKNLHALLKNRYEWMNNFIIQGDNILELGSGASLLKNFIKINHSPGALIAAQSRLCEIRMLSAMLQMEGFSMRLAPVAE